MYRALFFVAMEARAEERRRIKMEREERRMLEEQARTAQVFAREAEIRKQEEEEKLQRAEAHREKKRREKQVCLWSSTLSSKLCRWRNILLLFLARERVERTTGTNEGEQRTGDETLSQGSS